MLPKQIQFSHFCFVLTTDTENLKPTSSTETHFFPYSPDETLVAPCKYECDMSGLWSADSWFDWITIFLSASKGTFRDIPVHTKHRIKSVSIMECLFVGKTLASNSIKIWNIAWSVRRILRFLSVFLPTSIKNILNLVVFVFAILYNAYSRIDNRYVYLIHTGIASN